MANLNLNKAILAGRMTADPELKQTPSGTAVTTFNIAVNRSYQKDGDQEVDFITVVAWRERAEFVCKYFKKGSSICVVGSIQTRHYTSNNGEKRYATEVVADEVKFVDSKSDNCSAPTTYVPEAYTSPSLPAFEEMAQDDDLPF